MNADADVDRVRPCPRSFLVPIQIRGRNPMPRHGGCVGFCADFLLLIGASLRSTNPQLRKEGRVGLEMKTMREDAEKVLQTIRTNNECDASSYKRLSPSSSLCYIHYLMFSPNSAWAGSATILRHTQRKSHSKLCYGE
jgi:hypothetical protein